MRFLRSVLLFKLGVWVGMVSAARVMKHALPSTGDADSDEISLAAVTDGVKLQSRAKSFRGGSLLAWYGGIELDLREAELAPDARLTANAIFGGIDVKTPPGWRIESNVKGLGGGVDTPKVADEEGPVLALDGRAVFGGIRVSQPEPSPSR
jgi:hypothetical protein